MKTYTRRMNSKQIKCYRGMEQPAENRVVEITEAEEKKEKRTK